MVACLALSDLLTLTFAVWAGFFLWHFINPTIPPLNPLLLLVSGCCVAEFAYSGHYPGIGLIAVEHMRRICRGVTLVYLFLTAAMFLSKSAWADSRGALFVAWMLSVALAPLGRWCTSFILRSRSWWGVPVVVLGAGQTGRAVIHNLNVNKILGYRPVACLDDDPRKFETCDGVPVLGTLLDAGTVAARFGAQYAILAIPTMPRRAGRSGICAAGCRIFPKIFIVPNPVGVSSLGTEPRDLGGLLGLEMRQNLLNKWNQRLKRLLDVVASALGLLSVAPLLAVCALWIKRVSLLAQPSHKQEREGKDGTADTGAQTAHHASRRRADAQPPSRPQSRGAPRVGPVLQIEA